jgi:hypothetical protein
VAHLQAEEVATSPGSNAAVSRSWRSSCGHCGGRLLLRFRQHGGRSRYSCSRCSSCASPLK